MASDTTPAPLTIDHKPHAAFFRQSGWLMIASIFGGAMSFGVHFLNKLIPQGEYANFGVLVMVITCLPTMPLQMVFAQQSATALAQNRERQLAGMIRRAWFWTFVIWLIGAALLTIFRVPIIHAWKLSSSVPLFVTVATILTSIWLPLFSGIMQGRQDFFWFGWSLILGGIVRVAAAALLVVVFHAGATGMLGGALAGVGVAGAIVIWRTRDLWGIPPEPFNSRELLIQITPLVLAFGVCQFMFSTDTMFATPYFSPDSMKHYVVAGTLSRALLWLVTPLAAVMFPKIVHSSAKREKSNLLGIVIGGTALLAICGAVGLCIFGPLVIRIAFKAEDISETAALLPWYAAAMIPLALANVLVNDLMARGRFKVVPFMIVLAIGYGFTVPYMLHHYPGRMTVVLQTLGAYTSVLFLICAWFTWGAKSKSAEPEVEGSKSNV
jgi:O-antigen/teichoic acid export membrane protein